MADVVSLAAEVRGRAGKGGAREQRRAGRIPAVIYGDRQEPLMIALDGTEMLKQLRRPGFMAHVFEIVIERPQGAGAAARGAARSGLRQAAAHRLHALQRLHQDQCRRSKCASRTRTSRRG